MFQQLQSLVHKFVTARHIIAALAKKQKTHGVLVCAMVAAMPLVCVTGKPRAAAPKLLVALKSSVISDLLATQDHEAGKDPKLFSACVFRDVI